MFLVDILSVGRLFRLAWRMVGAFEHYRRDPAGMVDRLLLSHAAAH